MTITPTPALTTGFGSEKGRLLHLLTEHLAARVVLSNEFPSFCTEFCNQVETIRKKVAKDGRIDPSRVTKMCGEKEDKEVQLFPMELRSKEEAAQHPWEAEYSTFCDDLVRRIVKTGGRSYWLFDFVDARHSVSETDREPILNRVRAFVKVLEKQVGGSSKEELLKHRVAILTQLPFDERDFQEAILKKTKKKVDNIFEQANIRGYIEEVRCFSAEEDNCAVRLFHGICGHLYKR